jgi:protein-S-isoprenylcysteine O-methyltransferase Ste14
MTDIAWHLRLFYFPIIDLIISTLLYIIIRAKRMTSEGPSKKWHLYYWLKLFSLSVLLWFITFRINWAFWTGITICLLGYIIFSLGYLAMKEHPEKNKVVVEWGIYHYSRNSHLLASKITTLGIIIIGWNCDSAIYIFLWIYFVIDLILSHFAVLNEEKLNIEKFGYEFVEYMKKVPRYF